MWNGGGGLHPPYDDHTGGARVVGSGRSAGDILGQCENVGVLDRGNEEQRESRVIGEVEPIPTGRGGGTRTLARGTTHPTSSTANGYAGSKVTFLRRNWVALLETEAASPVVMNFEIVPWPSISGRLAR